MNSPQLVVVAAAAAMGKCWNHLLLSCSSPFSTKSTMKQLKRQVSPRKLPGTLRLNLAERVLIDRGAVSIKQIMHTAKERVSKQISTKTAHTVLPLSKRDKSSDTVKKMARSILLEQRFKASRTWTDKYGVPILSPVNGVGHFILPLQRILFTYCSHRADSTSLREYLKRNLKSLAESNPGVEFVVEPRWGHPPLLRGFFLDGHDKVLCVKNYTIEKVHEAFLNLRNSSGRPLRRFRQGVTSFAPAIRPLWSPFHMLATRKNYPLESFIKRPKL